MLRGVGTEMPHRSDKTVKDIMVPIEDYATVFLENTLRDAMFVLRSTFYSGCTLGSQAHRSVLVFDNKKSLVGTLSFRDIIHSLQSQEDAHQLGDGFARLCLFQANKKVKDIMRPVGQTKVAAEDSIVNAIHLLIREELELIPVEDNGVVVGMIRPVEIFKEVSELVEANAFI